MQKRKFDELVSYFNKKVSEMEIETKHKMELLGMVTALGCAHEKEMSNLSEIKRDSSDTISRKAAIDALDDIASDLHARKRFDEEYIASWCAETIEQLPSAQPVITCDGCKFVGTYDTHFPCRNCVRKEKDYYAPER